MAKLTLSMDQETIDLAKQLAIETNTSVSEVFRNTLRTVASLRRRRHKVGELAPITRRLAGSIKLSPSDQKKSNRQLIREAISERYES